MLRLPAGLVAELTAHAYAEHPLEACGVLVGAVGPGDSGAWRWLPLRNAAARTDYFELDSHDLLQLSLDLEAAGEETKAVCHSHTSTAAEPSPASPTTS